MLCFYSYPESALAVRFNHGTYDYVYMSLRIVDYGVVTAETAEKSRGVFTVREPIPTIRRLKLRMSGSCDPIPTMIAWLEALTCLVQSATWTFDGEGQDYDVTSTSNQLIIAIDREEVLRITISREQLVPALYCALRRFSESRRYRPENWETWGSGATPLGRARSALVERYITCSYIAPERSRWAFGANRSWPGQ